MKRIFILILSLVACMFGCSSTDNVISDYGCWNHESSVLIHEYFESFLPSKDLVNDYGVDYYYTYSEALLGNQNMVIFVELRLPEKEQFEEQLCKNMENASPLLSTEKGEDYYLLFKQEYISEYLDDEIYDGMCYNFKIMSTNKETNTIRYLIAHVWDNYGDAFLIDYLSDIKPLVD